MGCSCCCEGPVEVTKKVPGRPGAPGALDRPALMDGLAASWDPPRNRQKCGPLSAFLEHPRWVLVGCLLLPQKPEIPADAGPTLAV